MSETKIYGDYEYYINYRGCVNIVSYLGNGGDVTFPSFIEGHPVTQIGEDDYNPERICKNVSFSSLHIPDSVSYVNPDCLRFNSIGTLELTRNLDLTRRTLRHSCIYWDADKIIIKKSSELTNERFYGNVEIIDDEHRFIENDGLVFYLLDNGTLELTDCKKDVSKVTIPAICNGYKVSTVNIDCFYECDEIHLSEGIIHVKGKRQSLKTILYIPDSVRAVDLREYGKCAVRKNTVAHSILKKIGYADIMDYGSYDKIVDNHLYRFNEDGTAILIRIDEKCENLIVPEKIKKHIVKEIRVSWGNMSKLKSLTIPDSVTSLSDNFDISGLHFLEIPEHLLEHSRIDSRIHLFDITKKRRKRITLENKVVKLREKNTNLSINTKLSITSFTGNGDVKIPASVHTIGDNSFIGKNMKSVEIPENISYIGKNAFRNCRNLETVIIKGRVTLNDYAFADCKNLRKVVFYREPYYEMDISTYGIETVFAGCCNLEKITFECKPANEKNLEEKLLHYKDAHVGTLERELIQSREDSLAQSNLNYWNGWHL